MSPENVSAAEATWLQAILDREGKAFGTRADLQEDGRLDLRWD